MTFLSHAFAGSNHLWRYFVGILVVFIGYFVGQLIMMAILAFNVNFDISVLQEFESSMDFSIVGLGKNTGLILLLLMFVTALVALYFVITLLHGKNFLRLVTSRIKVDYGKILFGFGFWLVVMLIMEAVSYFLSPEQYQYRGINTDFWILLLISIVILPVQTSFEELFFRGYIMQGVAFFVRNKWLPVVLSSLFFGLVHSLNPEVEKYGFWTMQSYYMLAGGFLALITIWDEGLELALGVHWATNFGGAALLNYEGGVLQTNSLFMTTDINPWAMTWVFLLSSIIFGFVCHRKYHWPSPFAWLKDRVTE